MINNKILKNYGGALLALSVLVVLFSILSPYFFNVDNLLTILSQVSIIAIMAFGMTYVLMLGQTDLSVGAIAALSSLVLGVMLNLKVPTLLAILIAILSGLGAGLINGILGIKLNAPGFIITVATVGIFRGLVYTITDSKPVVIEDTFILALGNSKLFNLIPYTVIVMLVLMHLAQIVLAKTRFGRNAKMMGGNKVAAEYVGINTKSIYLKVFMISGIMAAISGILLASRLYSSQPNIAQGYELDAIASAVLGGTSLSGGYGSVIGTLLGSIVMGVINNGMNLIRLPYYYQQIVKGIIILIAVYLDIKNKKSILSKGGKWCQI